MLTSQKSVPFEITVSLKVKDCQKLKLLVNFSLAATLGYKAKFDALMILTLKNYN